MCLRAQLVLALEPQVGVRHLEPEQHVLALDQQVALLDLEPLDRERVERLLDLGLRSGTAGRSAAACAPRAALRAARRARRRRACATTTSTLTLRVLRIEALGQHAAGEVGGEELLAERGAHRPRASVAWLRGSPAKVRSAGWSGSWAADAKVRGQAGQGAGRAGQGATAGRARCGGHGRGGSSSCGNQATARLEPGMATSRRAISEERAGSALRTAAGGGATPPVAAAPARARRRALTGPPADLSVTRLDEGRPLRVTRS